MGKFGLEYNYGSKYWTPFILSHDDLLGNKLAARGHVGEIYYLLKLHPNASFKVGGIYSDFEYTGSGSPVGEPKKVSEVEKGTAYSLMPAIDTGWNAYLKIIVHF